MENDSAVANEKPETGDSAPEAVTEPAPVPTEPAPVPVPPEPPAPAPGEILRKAREARGESLGDLVQVLKLSYHQIEALENGAYDVLPEPTFVRGFLRNYARHLGLDPEPLLVGFGGQTPAPVNLALVSGGGANIPASMAKAPAKSGGFPVLLVVFVLLLALVGAGFFLGWFKIPDGLTIGAPQAGENGTVLQELPAPTVPAGQKQVVETLTVNVETLPAAGNTPANAAASADGGAPVPPAEAVPEISTLRFTFSANAWVQVREGPDGNSKLLFVGICSAGSSRNIRGTPPFSLVVAKADKVSLEYKGKPVDLMPHVANDGIARLTLQ
jgi:cytoskeleton protein RodZ